jgi:hypothetical protein
MSIGCVDPTMTAVEKRVLKRQKSKQQRQQSRNEILEQLREDLDRVFKAEQYEKALSSTYGPGWW